MSNLKIEGQKMIDGKPWLSRDWSWLGGLVLVAVLAAAPTLLGLGDAGRNARTFGVSFSERISSPPNVSSVVALGSAASNSLEDYGLRHTASLPVAPNPAAYYKGSDYAERRAVAKLAEFNMGTDFAQRRMAAQLAEYNQGTDFAQRHPEMTSWITAIDTSDYFLRHPEFLAVPPSLVELADAGEKGRSFEVSFTKWMSSPTGGMIGVVGEDVGAGTFAGQVVSKTDDETKSFTTIVAEYHINGSKHSFSADIKAVQDNGAGTGVITGVITEGWLKGRALSGTYNVLNPCNMATKDNVYGDPGLCFQGTLNVPAAP